MSELQIFLIIFGVIVVLTLIPFVGLIVLGA
jgi:hypothetical protein